jgi:CRP-like cAMP-binding protein
VGQLLREVDRPLEVVHDESDGLPSIPLFAALPKGAFAQILRSMDMRELKEGEVVVREGESARSFFILLEGRVRVEKTVPDRGPVTLAYLDEGACFGEMSLIDGSPRTATVVVERAAKIAEIDKQTLDETVERFPSVARALRDFYAERLLSTAMALHPFFGPFELAERRDLARGFARRSFAVGETLIHEGRPGEGFYLLLSGRLVVEKSSPTGPVQLGVLNAGDMFGEMSLLSKAPTTASVRADEDSMVLRLGRKTFERAQSARPEIRALLEEMQQRRLGENESRLSGRPGSDSR